MMLPTCAALPEAQGTYQCWRWDNINKRQILGVEGLDLSAGAGLAALLAQPDRSSQIQLWDCASRPTPCPLNWPPIFHKTISHRQI